MDMANSCKDCTERHIGCHSSCHSSCQTYAEYKQTREQVQANRLTLKESYERFKTLTERMENLKLKEEE